MTKENVESRGAYFVVSVCISLYRFRYINIVNFFGLSFGNFHHQDLFSLNLDLVYGGIIYFTAGRRACRNVQLTEQPFFPHTHLGSDVSHFVFQLVLSKWECLKIGGPQTHLFLAKKERFGAPSYGTPILRHSQMKDVKISDIYMHRCNELHLTSQSHLADIHLEGIGPNFYADVAPGSNIDSLKARDIGSTLIFFYIFNEFASIKFNLCSMCLQLISIVACTHLRSDWHFAIASAWGQCGSTQPVNILTDFHPPISVHITHMI